ncbi:hypothetical protein BTS2_3320 [Bacillus sp. TS-2]|nr:hypothetical protein BTS2_3320 [Bacillus sp. TS-2]
MAKTDLTKKLENRIYELTNENTFGCFEVTIGWYGKERVDYLTYDHKGIWRCYEIKVSLSDFRSKAKKSFYGHYNYYVMPKELFEVVKNEIPTHVGVCDGYRYLKRPKKQVLSIEEEVLKNSFIRSLARQSDKLMKSENPQFVEHLNRQINYEKKEKERYRRMYEELGNDIYKKFGRDWSEI